MIATKTRSLTKTITWRLLGSLDTLLLSWLITGKAILALTIASAEIITKLVLYYWHERIWNIVPKLRRIK